MCIRDRAAQKSAKASAKAAQKTAQTAKATAKVTAEATKATVKATIAAVKAIIAGTKACLLYTSKPYLIRFLSGKILIDQIFKFRMFILLIAVILEFSDSYRSDTKLFHKS